MVTLDVIINNNTGLHARPASLFSKEANRYKSSIKVVKEGKEYNAKSILSVLTMGAGQGSKLTIIAEGVDEEAAIYSLKDLIDNNLGE